MDITFTDLYDDTDTSLDGQIVLRVDDDIRRAVLESVQLMRRVTGIVETHYKLVGDQVVHTGGWTGTNVLCINYLPPDSVVLSVTIYTDDGVIYTELVDCKLSEFQDAG